MRTLALELQLFLADRATRLVLIVFSATLVYGIVNGVGAGEAARSSAQALEHETNEWNQQVKAALDVQYLDPLQVARRPAIALLPPAPLPALAIGQSDLLSAYEEVDLLRLEKPSEGKAGLENPARLMAGSFDLAFVLVWLFPLFLLAAAYDLCAGDREAGTLRMVLAQGVSPWRWIALRALARGAPLMILAVGATLVAGTLFADNGGGLRVLLAVFVVLAYGLFWLALAALVNAFARSASAAATAVGALWVLFVLVLPTLLNVVAQSLHPSPSRAELVAEARAAAAHAEKRGNELLSSFYRDHPELAPPGMQANMTSHMLAVQDEVGRAMEPVKRQFDDAILEQQGVVDLWRFASPAISVNEALADLAGTGYWRHREFQAQVGAFKAELHTFYSPKFHRGEPLTKADLPNLPVFEFVEEDFSHWAGRVTSGLIGILALVGLIATAAGLRLTPRRLAG